MVKIQARIKVLALVPIISTNLSNRNNKKYAIVMTVSFLKMSKANSQNLHVSYT
jgi:hypothetical protein